MVPVPGKGFTGINANTTMQVVALHGNIAGDGQLSEVEILASTNPTMNQPAVDQATSIARGRVPVQPGATMQSSEIFLTFEFLTQ